MIPRFVIVIVALVLVFLFLRWFVRTPPEQVAARLKRTALWAAVAFVIYLAATGKLHWLFGLLASMAPFLRRLGPLLRYLPFLRHILSRFPPFPGPGGPFPGGYPGGRPGGHAGPGAGRGPAAGRSSQVETRFVRMTLDHDTGEIEGLILEGRYKGRHLSELALEELVALWRECLAVDQESARLVQAYLDNVHGEDWRRQAGASDQERATPGSGTMSREEAYEILGLEPGASREEIIAAHRRLMQKLHPDRGGSTYLAAKINQAKDLLLDEADREEA